MLLLRMCVSRLPQLVMLGSGGEEYESAMRENEQRFPQHFRGWVRLLCAVSAQQAAATLAVQR